MEQASKTINGGYPEYQPGLWQDTVNLLKEIQIDYQGLRKQLDQINLQIAAKEAVINQQFQRALLSSQGYDTLRLVKSAVDHSMYRLGSVVLGGITQLHQSQARLEIRCLGRFEITMGAKPIERWHSLKAKSVFQFLLINPFEPTSKDKILEALWPDSTAQAANNNLKAAIHSLRSNLNEIAGLKGNKPPVLFSAGGYSINPEINLWLDVAQFENLRDQGRRFEKENRLEAAIDRFEKAETLYRGEYLEEEPYEEWTLIRRETLKDNYLRILNKLAEFYFMTTDYENCINYSLKIIARDPSREDAYRNIMRSYLKLNQKNRALRWYEICCQAIKRELDTLPERETLTLGNSIMIHPVDRE